MWTCVIYMRNKITQKNKKKQRKQKELVGQKQDYFGCLCDASSVLGVSIVSLLAQCRGSGDRQVESRDRTFERQGLVRVPTPEVAEHAGFKKKKCYQNSRTPLADFPTKPWATGLLDF